MQIKFFKKEKKFKKEGLELDVNFYWRLAVGLMFFFVLAASVFGYYFFVQINRESVSEMGEDSARVRTVKKERIDKVLQYFSAREQKSNEILNSPAPVIDPSL